MRIEDYWEDTAAYYVSFEGVNNQRIDRLIILPAEMEDIEEVRKIVITRFNNVQRVLAIDKWDDTLLLKC
ncbi:conserved hypothetical protein [Carnobacterium maltaromaticum]|uniref:hypothetical protein n=1 Tax=Carnobacterium maltaromaticum TaxID=2751 RepID=UPI00191BC358|nr:hypothetical protein [Carnobacterium maltaromaticum]CAD5898798.1 conserved hypothetical protein [Carnobacterium maltaromaticum]